MKLYVVLCIRDETPRLIHAYQEESKAMDMLSYLLDINSDDETPMYLMKEAQI